MRSGRGEGKEGEGKGREGREGRGGEGRREFLATNDSQQFSNGTISFLLTLTPKEEKKCQGY